MKKCKNCGTVFPDEVKYCGTCGETLDEDSIISKNQYTGTEKTENRTAQKDSTLISQYKSNSINNKLLIALISAVLIIAGLGGYILIGRSSADKKSVAQSQSIQTQDSAKTAATQEVKKEVPKEEKTGFIVGTNVNAREKASTDSAVVGMFSLGEKVVIISDESEWAKVKRSDGKECYVFKKFLGDQAALDKRQAKYNVKDGPYPVYLNGNPDYVLLYGHMGTAWYVVKSSLHRSKTSRTAINIAAVSDADKGNTNISSIKTYNYWFNDVGLSYWFNDNPNNQYGADLGTKDVGAIVALSGYEAACYIRNQYKANPKHFLKVFYDRLNP